MKKRKSIPPDPKIERHYLKLKGNSKPLMILRINLDKIDQDGIYDDGKGNKFISISVNQSQFDRGSVFLTQALPADKITEEKMRIVGIGGKEISMDYWIEEINGGDYLEYTFEQIEPRKT